MRPTFASLSVYETEEVRKCVSSAGFRLILLSMETRAQVMAQEIALGLLESDPVLTATVGMPAATASRNEDMKSAAGMVLAVKAIQEEISKPQIKPI